MSWSLGRRWRCWRTWVCRVPDLADAANLLGDVLLVVWRRIDAMPPSALTARMWMFGIDRKVLSGSRRSYRRRQALTARLRDELAAAGSREVAPVADADRLSAALDQLSVADREILSLLHWDSFTLTEAAQHLHLRPGTVRSRYHRARHRLTKLREQGQ